MKYNPKVFWLQGITCNGNSHSFFNAPNFEILLNQFDFIYHPLFETDYTLKDIIEKDFDIDILILEGAFKKIDFKRSDAEISDLILRYGANAKAVICAGNCASFGGMFRLADPDNIGGLLYKGKEEYDFFSDLKEKTINLPGCPLHPEWLVFVLQMVRAGKKIALDELRRPLELYAYSVHDGCLRNEYFEWKIDAKQFGLKEGCLFYEHGCQGPFTHGSCNKILWNEVSSKTRVGMPCIGCTEPTFPSSNLFETKTLMSIPAKLPMGVPKRAYLTATGIAKAFKIERLQKRLINED